MNIKSAYEKLYPYWLKESEDPNLIPLSEDVFNEFKQIIEIIKNLPVNENNKIEAELLGAYKENFDYMFKDFLKLREIKILNAALALKEINLTNVVEAEKLFFRTLVSAVKGFKKVKAISAYKEGIDTNLEFSISEVNIPEVNIQEDTKPEEDDLEDIDLEELFAQESHEPLEIEKTGKTAEKIESITPIVKKDVAVNYVLIRFVKETPPLVGIDLLDYGPYEKENIAYMPYKNARILMEEKFAELIEL